MHPKDISYRELSESDRRRFWIKVNRDGPVLEVALGHCWQWISSISKRGYGEFWLAGGTDLAHRVAYWIVSGPIPEGLVLDHLCRNRSCVRPDHLEPVPFATNVLRGDGLAAQAARQETCANGHPFDSRAGKQRTCRICRNAANRRYRERSVNAGA